MKNVLVIASLMLGSSLALAQMPSVPSTDNMANSAKAAGNNAANTDATKATTAAKTTGTNAANTATTTMKTETTKTTTTATNTANTAKTTEGGMLANAKTKAGSLLDINSAPASELKNLPGVSDATANKIVAGRPYKTKADLVKRNLLTQDTYEKIKPLVIAHTTGATSAVKNVKNVTP